MKTLGLFIAVLLIFQGPLSAQTSKTDHREYGPPPGAEIQELERLLSGPVPPGVCKEHLSGRIDNTPIMARAHHRTPARWCYPDEEESFCGWLVPVVIENTAKSEDGHINFTGDEEHANVFVRNGRVLSWTGAIHYENLYGLRHPINAVFPSAIYANETTKSVVQVSLSLSDKFSKLKREETYDYSLQYGFFLRLALEREGYHWIPSPKASPEYSLIVNLQNVRTEIFRWSLPTKIESLVTVRHDAEEISEFKVEGKGASKRSAVLLIDRQDSAMNAALADAAKQVIQELSKQRGTKTFTR